jgi:hypothetical protein
MPGCNLRMAVPVLVSCAVPSRWMPAQDVAEASQKLTGPIFSLVVPASTAAVSVISLPDATEPPEAIALPPEVMAKVVVVAAGAAQACCGHPQITITNAAATKRWQGILTFMCHRLSYCSPIILLAFAGRDKERAFFSIFSTMIGATEIARMLPEPAMREKVLASARDFLLHSC